jgi:Tol biopolymer transport system component
LNLIERDGASVKLEPRAMDLLVYFTNTAGRVVSTDELIKHVWHDRVFDDARVYKTINQLRKALGDQSQAPKFIETIPKRGYRLVAAAVPLDDGAAPPPRDTVMRKGWRLTATVGAAMLVAAAAGSFFAYRGSREELVFVPLSFERGYQGDVVWSPDSRSVAFAAQTSPTELPQIHVRHLDSHRALRVTELSTGAIPAEWTSSGNILFGAARPPQGLWSVSPIGGEPEAVLSDVTGGVGSAARSITRDGSALAVLRRGDDGSFGIWTAARGESGLGPLQRYEPAPFESTRYAHTPVLRFSPDGKQILLMWNAFDGETAWLMPYPSDPANPPRRVLESLPAIVTPDFSWMPDGRHIVLSMVVPHVSRRLYIADVVSGNFRELSGGTTAQAAPVVSPDGAKLVFTELRLDLDIDSVNFRTAATTTVLATDRMETMPAWAMQGSVLAYVTNRNGAPEIWLHEPGESDRPIVTTRDFPGSTPLWFVSPEPSPDGSRVAYAAVEGDATTSRLWMSGIAGDPPVPLLPQAERGSPGSWSPDGRWYVYTRSEEAANSLRKVRTTGGAEPEIVAANVRPAGSAVPRWSPNGEWILHDDRGLKLTSVDGKTTRDLGVEDALCAFARDDELLYCIDAPMTDRSRRLFAMSYHGRIEQVIGSLAAADAPVAPYANALRLTLAPDGASAVYSTGTGRSYLWLVDGLADVPLP